MQQLAPTGQLVPINDKLFYEAPTGERVQVKDDRASLLAKLLPLAMSGQLNEAQMQMVRRDHDAVLQSVSSRYHELAMSVVGQQQRTIDGLVGVLNKLADPVEVQQPVIVRETIVEEDFAGKIVFVLSLVFGLMVVSFTVCTIARMADGAASVRPQHVEYYR